MVKGKMGIGAMAFLGLTVLAIISGIGMPASMASISLILMGVFGIIAGFVNIKSQEVVPFLVSIMALVVGGAGIGLVAAFDVISLGATVISIVNNLASAYATMGIVVGLKTILATGKN